MMQIAGLLLAGMVMGALIRPAIKVAGRWYSWKRATVEASRVVANAHRIYRHAEGLLMAPAYKHGGHRQQLSVDGLAAGAAVDTSDLWTYDGEVTSILGTLDQSIEAVKSAVFVIDTTQSAVATNNYSVVLSHYSKAGVLKNQIVYGQAAAGFAATQFVPIDLSGPVTAILTNPTGVVIQGDGWKLVPGDTLQLKRTSNGTGQASGGFAVTIKYGSVGS